ncbi:MAG: FecR domain-containing protein [Bacteriovoracia bacterium]
MVVLLFSVFTIASVADAAPAAKNNAAGQAVSVVGRVICRNEDAELKKAAVVTRELKAGDALFEGDVINTSSNSSVKLMLTDKSIVDLGPSTLFKVSEYRANRADLGKRNVSMEVLYGKIRASVNSKLGQGGSFKVKTRSATMGVRGTEFAILSELLGAEAEKRKPGGPTGTSGKEPPAPGKTEIIVIEGKVAVKADGAGPGAKKEMMVAQNQKITMTAPPADRSPGSSVRAAPVEVKVAEVSKQEMRAVTSDVKLQDKTFTQAVVIEKIGDGKAGGAQTLALLGQAMAGIQVGPTNIGELGFSGGFGPDLGFGGGSFTPVLPGQMVRVTVKFTP